MTLNFNQISGMIAALEGLKDTKMPFKLSLILAKNISKLKAEQDFFIERERDFALKYLDFDEETQQFVQIENGVFKVKPGMEEECRQARTELNEFSVDIDLRMIPVSLIENLDCFTPSDLEALELLINEEE